MVIYMDGETEQTLSIPETRYNFVSLIRDFADKALQYI
jgi:hypothetical protein